MGATPRGPNRPEIITGLTWAELRVGSEVVGVVSEVRAAATPYALYTNWDEREPGWRTSTTLWANTLAEAVEDAVVWLGDVSMRWRALRDA